MATERETPTTRAEADIMALAFIKKHPGDCVGTIETEEQLAAAMIFIELKRRGLLMAEIGPDGPRYFITKSGERELERAANVRT